jgi:hypothetical protein
MQAHRDPRFCARCHIPKSGSSVQFPPAGADHIQLHPQAEILYFRLGSRPLAK